MRRRSALTSTVAVAALLAATVAVAHPPPRAQDREIVRLAGQRSADAPAPAGRMQLRAQGADHPFAATAAEIYMLTSGEAPRPAPRYNLQGERALLARFAGARPEQTITILAEHHPGSQDLFVLSVDLCPPK